MKTINIRLDDEVYEELNKMLIARGQDMQTFYEAYTKAALRGRYVIKTPLSEKHISNNHKLEAFNRLEESRKSINKN